MLNLVSNALKFTFKGKIIIRASPLFIPELKSWALLISVRDTGIGISEEDQKKLFRWFGKLEKTGLNSHGIGLGLMICKSIVEAAGG